MRIKIRKLQSKIKLCNISVIGSEEGSTLRPKGVSKLVNENNFNSSIKSNGQVEDYFSPCPMLYLDNEGYYFCLNQDGFDMVNYFPIHFKSLEIFQKSINNLTIEKNHSNLCFDICFKRKDNDQLFCFNRDLEIKTREIRLTIQRLNNLKELLTVLSDDENSDLCRECLYKIFVNSIV